MTIDTNHTTTIKHTDNAFPNTNNEGNAANQFPKGE